MPGVFIFTLCSQIFSRLVSQPDIISGSTPYHKTHAMVTLYRSHFNCRNTLVVSGLISSFLAVKTWKWKRDSSCAILVWELLHVGSRSSEKHLPWIRTALGRIQTFILRTVFRIITCCTRKIVVKPNLISFVWLWTFYKQSYHIQKTSHVLLAIKYCFCPERLLRRWLTDNDLCWMKELACLVIAKHNRQVLTKY